jgi:hypothetical protein
VKVRCSLAVLTVAFTGHAAQLKPEASKVWQEYIRTATAAMEQHLRPESHFLDIDENQDSVRRVRAGEILISPAGSESPKKIPSGIIHDWIGRALVEHAELDEVLSVARDYDHYKEFYQPTVIDSKALARGGREDRFSMVSMNESLFSKVRPGQ